MAEKPNEPERPRVEPEIIPPDRNPRGRRPDDRGSGWPPPPYGYAHGTQRIYVSRIGPFGFALLLLVVGLFAGVLLLALIGAALIWIPVVVVFLIIVAVSGLFRRL